MNGAITRDDRTVHVGANSQVSMQVLQDIYNDITGKSEKISQAYTDSYAIEMEDLKQLHAKIRQMYEQYHIVSDNCNVTVYHVKDSKERFSSFERFSLYDRSNVNPIENINLVYEFLIVLPKVDRPQPYKIEFNLHSRVGLIIRTRSVDSFGEGFFHFLTPQSAVIEIDYVDYAVARNFKSTIDQWMESLRTTEKSFLSKKIRKTSEYFPLLFKNVTAISVAASFYHVAPDWLEKHQQSYSSMFSIGIIAFSCVYVASDLAKKLGSLTQRWVDRSYTLSYIKLNRGDENAIQDFHKGERIRIAKVFLGVGLTIGVNVLSNWVSKFFGV